MYREEEEKQSKNNLTAIVVGFLLIVFVIVLFFIKSSFLSRKNEKIIQNETKKQDNELKKYKSIKAEELFEKIISKANIEIIDIRDPIYFQSEHIQNSKNISVSELDSKLNSLEKSKSYVIIDDFGISPEALQAVKLLIDNDFQNTAYLEGGISNWKNRAYSTINAGDPSSFIDQSKVTYIKSDELKDIISTESNFLYVIDLRNENNFQEGHIKGAVNIPIDELENRRRQIPFGKKIILYDDSGFYAFQGAVRLFDMGVLNVFTLSDGLNTWKQKGFELVK